MERHKNLTREAHTKKSSDFRRRKVRSTKFYSTENQSVEKNRCLITAIWGGGGGGVEGGGLNWRGVRL